MSGLYSAPPVTAQSASAVDPGTGGTIATAGISVARIAPAAAETGGILQAGTKAGQTVVVVNESGFTFTFAVVATSNVSNGTTCVIAANASKFFVWNTSTSRWYPHS